MQQSKTMVLMSKKLNAPVQFGKRIKLLRNSLNLSQEKIATKIGIDRTYYASVESGKRNISIENIKKIADGFNITLAELFEHGFDE